MFTRPGRLFLNGARQDSKHAPLRQPTARVEVGVLSRPPCRPAPADPVDTPGGHGSDGPPGKAGPAGGATELQTGLRAGWGQERESRRSRGRFASATRKTANRKRFGAESKCPAWSLVASAEKSTGNADYPLESCRGSSGVLSRDSRFSTGVLSRKLLTESNNRTNSLSDKTPNCWH